MRGVNRLHTENGDNDIMLECVSQLRTALNFTWVRLVSS